MVAKLRQYSSGFLLTLILAALAIWLNKLVPGDLIGTSILVLLLGMFFHPVVDKMPQASSGVHFVSTTVLKVGIILMGISLSFSQVLMVVPLPLMVFTLQLPLAVVHLWAPVW